MHNLAKAATLVAGLLGASALAGCEPAYCDGYGCHGAYRYHDDRYYDRDRDRGARHWVCDRDGDDCHWSYDR